ncbi:MAG: tRNA (N6-threonylcarbamoyladenosine(37)-N6)-methyltransferase TrmO [Armatimonadota bacterium]
MDQEEWRFRPIGVIRTPYKEEVGMPIQGAFAPGSVGTVEVFPQFEEGLDDCEGFSHLYLIYVFHQGAGYRLKCTPFRDDRPRGVFATRAPRRPNPIGLTVVKLERRSGAALEVRGVDMLDGTPLLDIKPYVPEFDARDNVATGWLEESHDRRTADGRFAERWPGQLLERGGGVPQAGKRASGDRGAEDTH